MKICKQLTRQRENLLIMLDNMDEVKRLQDVMATSTGQAEKKFDEAYGKSTAAKIAEFRHQLEMFWQSAISTELINGFIAVGKTVLGVIDIWTNKNILLGIGFIALIKVLMTLTASFKAMNMDLITYITLTSEAGVVTNLFQLKSIALTGVMTGLSGALKMVSLGLKFLFLTPMGWVILLMSSVVALTMAWQKHKQKVEENKQKMNELAETAKQNMQQNDDMIKYLRTEGGEYDTLRNKTSLTVEEQQKLTSIRERLAQQFPSLIKGYDSEGSAILDAKKNTEDYIEILQERNRLENARIVSNGKNLLSEKQGKYADLQKEINDLQEEANRIRNGGDSVGKGDYSYRHTLDGLLEIQKTTGLTTKQQEELNRKTEEYAQKMNLVKSKIIEQKEIVDGFKSTMTAIYSDKNLDSFTQKLAEIKIDPRTFISSDGKMDFTSILIEVQKFKDELENNSNFKNVKLIMQMENPKIQDVKKYFEGINDLAKTFNTDPLELTEIFPLKADKQVVAKMIDEYIKELENQLKNTNPKEITALKDKINTLNGLKIQLNIEGTDSINNAVSSVGSLEEAMKTVATKMKEAKSVISDVNDVLDKHAKTNEWDMESIVELAQKYPQLLQKLGDDKALTEELVKIKNEEKNSVVEGLKVKIAAQGDYINKITDGYEIDINNFKTAEEAKNEILGKSLNKRLAMYKQDADNALKASMSSSDPMVRENAQRGAMRAGALYGMEYAKIDSSIDTYFELKRTYDGLNGYLGKVGSDNSDGKKNGGSDKSPSIFNATPLNRYDSAIATINDSLSQTDDRISTISQKIQNLQSLESKSNYADIIEQENAKLDEQNNKLNQLSSSKTQAQSLQDQIKNEFYSNFSSMKGLNLATLTDSDWTNLYNKMYGKDINFGTGDKAKLEQERYQNGAKLFQELMKSYQSASDLVKKLSEDELKMQQEINSTIKEKIDLQIKGYDELLDKQSDVIGDIQDKIDLLDIGNDNNKFEEKISLLEQISNQNKKELKEITKIRDGLLVQLSTLKEGTLEWNLLTEQVEIFNEKVDEGTKAVAQSQQAVTDARKDQISFLASMENEIVNALKNKYEKELEESKKAKAKELLLVKNLTYEQEKLIESGSKTRLEIFEEEHDKIIKALNDELDLYEDIYNTKIKEIDRQEDKDSYDKDLNKKQQEKSKLQAQYDSLLMDSSLEAQGKRADLLEQIALKEEEINEFIHDRSVELRKENLQDELDSKKKSIQDKIDKENEAYKKAKDLYDKEAKALEKSNEEKLKSETLYAEARQMLMENNLTTLTELLTKYGSDSDKIFSSIGETIKKEIVDNLKTAVELTKDISQGGSGKTSTSTNGTTTTSGKLTVKTTNGDTIDVEAFLSDKDLGDMKWEWLDAYNFGDKTKQKEVEDKIRPILSKYKIYESGGLNTSTGWHWLDGTNTRPELVLNSTETQAMLGLKDKLPPLLKAIQTPALEIPKFELPNLSDVQSMKSIELKIDRLINIEGNVDKSIIPEIKQAGNNTLNQLRQALNKQGIKKVL